MIARIASVVAALCAYRPTLRTGQPAGKSEGLDDAGPVSCCSSPRHQASSGEVGTGAGEGAPRQDTGSAWVTRSAGCPEAPAQAHLPVDPTPEFDRTFHQLISELVEGMAAVRASRHAEDWQAWAREMEASS